MVAQARGAQFGTMAAFPDGFVPVGDVSTLKAKDALLDVARWLGFRTGDEYVKNLGLEGAAIFKRAKRASSTPDAAPPAERGEGGGG